ncbi:MAG TPA: tryptophan synthase subunit alpha, partial [Phycicoccus sp.]|nr:tryptophan synthase subunit alpha [Phycicoccus sp.]
GVIVGSALVRCLAEARELDEGLEALRSLTAELAAGVREGRP